MTGSNDKTNYEVLTPWSEADPITPRSLTALRPGALAGKKIGLLQNSKRAAKPMLESLERHLKERLPSAQIIWYIESFVNTPEVDSSNKSKFEEWLKTVDAVVLAYAD